MTWEEAQDTTGFKITGIVSLAAAFFMNLLNGTLLKVFPDLNLPEMNINDILTILISVVGIAFTLVKTYHEILKIIDKRQDIKDKKVLFKSMKRHKERNQSKINESTEHTGGEEEGG